MRRLLFALALLPALLCAGPARAQPGGNQAALPQTSDGTPRLSPQAQMSLLTILPGDGPASAFGHSALRVRDPARGLDRTYNYGTYNFQDPYFIPKFVYGQLTYLVVAAPFRPFLQRYRRLGRPVIEQKLRLSPAQAQRLFAFLERNTRAGHRTYEYDFLFDNCATRIRDALRSALGARLRFEKKALPRRTFREHLDRFVAGMPLLDFGFDLGLGLPVERVATPAETMFLPEYLMEGFAGATVRTPGGDAPRRPLVARTDTLFWQDGAQFPARAAFPWVTISAWALFAALAGLTGWRWARARAPRAWPDVLLFGAVGAGGVVVWFLAFLSEHEVTRQNLNVVWMWPTHLLFAGALLLERANGRLARGYLLAAAVAALGLALGWPLWPQDLHAAAFPFVAMIALRGARRGEAAAFFRAMPSPTQRLSTRSDGAAPARPERAEAG
jgi:hypothetical protein